MCTEHEIFPMGILEQIGWIGFCFSFDLIFIIFFCLFYIALLSLFKLF